VSGSTSFSNNCLQNAIPSYLYQQYSDDDDLQAFVYSYNAIAQQYVNTFNQLNLPVYTSPTITGDLLDWVGKGIYGYPRADIPGTAPASYGPLNTYGSNYKYPLNSQTSTSGTTFVTTDDVYKRLLTWHFYKGDGKTFNVRWLKRRIMRFLTGDQGADPGVNTTYQISVTFGAGNAVSITMPTYPLATILKAAIDSGAAELPFQFAYTVTVTGPVGGNVLWANNSGATVAWQNNSLVTLSWVNY